MPGNPAQAREAQDILHGMTPAQAQRETAAMFGFVPKQPLADQYGHYMWQLLHFNLGVSIAQEGTPVAHIVASAFPWTVILALSGILISFLIGVCLGVLAAVKRSTRQGDALTLGGAVVNGIPVFVIAILLFYLFTTIWALFPQGGNVSITYTPGFNAGYIGSLVTHAVLPVTAYALSILRRLDARHEVERDLGAGRRLHPRRRTARHCSRSPWPATSPATRCCRCSRSWPSRSGCCSAARSSSRTSSTTPASGRCMISSISDRDYPVMDGAFLLITSPSSSPTSSADLRYSLIDPRVEALGRWLPPPRSPRRALQRASAGRGSARRAAGGCSCTPGRLVSCADPARLRADGDRRPVPVPGQPPDRPGQHLRAAEPRSTRSAPTSTAPTCWHES